MIEARRELARFLNVRTASGPAFTHDGQRVVFMADYGGVPQLWSVPAAGGWPEQHTFHPHPVLGVCTDPLRDRWLVLGERGGGGGHLHLLESGGAVDVVLTRQSEGGVLLGCLSDDGSHVAYTVHEEDPSGCEVVLRPLGDRGELKARRLLEGSGTWIPSVFSPDGRHVLVQEVRGQNDQDLHLVTIETGERRLLTGRPGEGPVRHLSPRFTRDGAHLFLLSDRDDDHLRLWRLRLSDLTWQVVDSGGWDVEALAGSHFGSLLAYSRNVEGASEIHVLDPERGEDTLVEGLPRGVVVGLALSHEGRRLAVSLSCEDRSGDIFVVALPDGTPRQITFSGTAGIPQGAFARSDLVRCTAFDGRVLRGLLYRPGDVERPPVILWTEGGPGHQHRPAFHPLIQYLVNRGFAVLAPNIRGSGGYGKGFAALDDVRLRPDAVRDLLSFAHWAKEQGDLQGLRLGAVGSGYGGFLMLSALAEEPGLWSAAVDVVGLADLVGLLARTPPWLRRLQEQEYGSLAEDADFLAQVSPVNALGALRTPMLVVQDVADPLAPATAADRIVSTLRSGGVEVEVLRYEGADAGQRLAGWPAIADFLERHLG